MSALSPQSLRAACRSIYVAAADDTILPPLIRDAADLAPPRRTIAADVADVSVRFSVVHENSGLDASGRPERPPLRFDIDATSGAGDAPLVLSAAERCEMIRAYLLGVSRPVAVDTSADGGWSVALRIAPRFVIAAPEPVRLDAGHSAGEICQRLAERLLESTRPLFGSRAAGLEVWETRLREELFAERRRAACEIWPAIEPAAAAGGAPRSVAPRPAAPAISPPARRRSLIAAALALFVPASLAGALAGRSAGVDRPAAPRIENSPIPNAVVRARALPAPQQSKHPAPESGEIERVRFAMLAPTVARAALEITSASRLTLWPKARPHRP